MPQLFGVASLAFVIRQMGKNGVAWEQRSGKGPARWGKVHLRVRGVASVAHLSHQRVSPARLASRHSCRISQAAMLTMTGRFGWSHSSAAARPDGHLTPTDWEEPQTAVYE